MITRLTLLMVFMALVAGGCAKKQDKASVQREEKKSAPQAGKFKIGLVFDVGGRGDKSFNDAAFAGVQRAQKELGTGYEYIEPGEGADREAALRQLASQPDIALIVGAGFIFTDDINAVAKEFPEKKFVCIDYTVDTTKPLPPNLSAIVFKEEEGSFLVGAIAALVSKTGTIGFVGGMESPLIKRFEKGYQTGAKYVRPDINILVGYAGLSGEGFKNPAKGKELALGQYSKNADVIYHASGITGLGVFEAARTTKKFVIGVDMNQENEAPGLVLTSMVKLVENAVLQAAKDVDAKTFKGGQVVRLGLANKGVDYVYNDNNKSLIPDDVHKKVEELRAKLVSGELSPL
ncbi:MAG: membrane protein [[Candidatus Thermochlorobacteriaceae] bacterium GBChlB]|nr:MAG: membrane protein [[Candidatus Thermochlorobacteriaceae] bacterium GBChlB]